MKMVFRLASDFAFTKSPAKLLILETPVNTTFDRVPISHRMGKAATHPQVALAGRLASLLFAAGSDHAASSRCATDPARPPPAGAFNSGF